MAQSSNIDRQPRVVVYARYSSDKQSDASIEDQIRMCRARIDREGWTFQTAYTDHAISGANRLRPLIGMYLRMLAPALKRFNGASGRKSLLGEPKPT